MQIARKLTLPLALSVFAVLGVATWFSVQADIELQEGDMQRDQRIYGQILASAVLAEAKHAKPLDALGLVNEANRDQNRVLFLYLRDDELATKGSLGLQELERLRAGETLFKVDRSVWGKASTWVPLTLPSGETGALWVQEPINPQRESLYRIIQTQVVSAIALGIFWALVAVGLGAAMVGRPMRKLAEKARRIARGDLTEPLTIEQRDEIGELATEMNRMCEELAAARQKLVAEAGAHVMALEQLRHADRLNTVGKLASGIAHELGTPLTVISMRSKMIASGEVQGDQAVTSARIVAGQADTIARIIRQLMDFARRVPPSITHESLDSLVSQTLAMVRPLAEKSGSTLVMETSPHIDGDFDRGQVQQALTNLVMNAVQAMPTGGQVGVRVDSGRERPPADLGGQEANYARITVADQGTGIAPELLPRIFEPFFTTKPVGEGTGLGLSVAWGLVRDHHGWISVESVPGTGSRFTIHLPLESTT